MFDNCFLCAVQLDVHNMRTDVAGRLDFITLKEQGMNRVAQAGSKRVI
jgi:hypothetical protein